MKNLYNILLVFSILILKIESKNIEKLPLVVGTWASSSFPKAAQKGRTLLFIIFYSL